MLRRWTRSVFGKPIPQYHNLLWSVIRDVYCNGMQINLSCHNKSYLPHDMRVKPGALNHNLAKSRCRVTTVPRNFSAAATIFSSDFIRLPLSILWEVQTYFFHLKIYLFCCMTYNLHVLVYVLNLHYSVVIDEFIP